MKKIGIIFVCLLFFCASIVAAAPGLSQQHRQTQPVFSDGIFDANIGYKRQGQNATIVGTMNGTYELRTRGGRFIGDWSTENRTGTLRGIFGRHLLVGRISTMINGTQRSLPIVGFLRAYNNTLLGRFMAPIGPALYFWGTYT
jgi:hypothetical protein